jgi:tRNA-splicing ligase RtcB (3'-phosphate/5'-hydroxy nucleic acid ligase)
MNKKITGNDLINIGFTEGKIIGLVLELLKNVNEHPENFLDDTQLSTLATAIIEAANSPEATTIELLPNPEAYSIYGTDFIEEGAKKQMDVAMKLPVTVAGALMPDAHQGYGLPIGGVLATHNAIIPYGVGVDIGCRMALSIFDITEDHFNANTAKYKRELIAHTKFGAGNGFQGQHKADHQVLASDIFNLTPFIKQLHDKAYTQLGSSGGGNHFVEWGIIEFNKRDEILNIDKGRYLALLSHSGSRGFGATIAGHYTRLAKELCKLPQEAINLAYLHMDSDTGKEYWLAMNLAGDYASACHDIIHQKLTTAIGAEVLAKVENHHNFAWKEKWHGEDVIVHRKGATPAGYGVMGIIPGSMTAPGFLVRGKGIEHAINSASHGAGRQMSRTKAIQNISNAEMKAALAAANVVLIGAGLDEAPMAYKNIETVMAAQQNLVDVVAKFNPRMVRMADDGSRED